MKRDRSGFLRKFLAKATSPALCVVICVCALGTAPVCGQGSTDSVPLVEREPYDVLTVGGSALKVWPIPFPGRKVPDDPDPRSRLKVRLLDDDEKEYEVFWENVDGVQLFEQLLLTEAERLRDAELFDEAFAYYYRLRQSYRGLEGLEESLNRFLFLEARELIRARRYAVALASMEELHRRAPTYRHNNQGPSLTAFLDRLVDRVAQSLVEDRQYAAARAVLRRAEMNYGAGQLNSIARWKAELTQLAVSRRDEGRTHLGDLEYRDAVGSVREMMEIWPQVEGGRELDAEIAKQYPMVTVAVTELATDLRSNPLGSWPTRRIRPLIERPLIEFLGPGPEGGQYDFSLGSIERSDDRRSLVFHLSPAAREAGYRANEVARELLELADPASRRYRSSWGGLMLAATTEKGNQVHVDLRRPHVLPEAVLAGVPLSPPSDPTAETGESAFEFEVVSSQEASLRATSFQPGAPLAEVVELKFDDPTDAIEALELGKVDMIDRLFPADAAQLAARSESNLNVRQYALPTVHMLVPTSDHPLIADRDFRRALLFAIDRRAILQGDLLGGRSLPGCRLISGPFPIGLGNDDPLGYAYDPALEPRAYLPALAVLLKDIARQRVANRLAELGQALPEQQTLVLGHPPHELARVTCQAISDQWKRVGFDCELLELQPGRRSGRTADLTYLEVMIQEPLVDADRLLGPNGLVPTTNPHVSRALRWLRRAQNWADVSERLREVHRAMHDEVAVLPLWQLVHFYAYSSRISEVGERPLSLYQNVGQWRVALAGDGS